MEGGETFPVEKLTPVHASKLSAQSPAWRRNASFRWTSPSWCRKRSIWDKISAEIRVPLGQAHLGRRNKGRQCLEFREHSGCKCPMSYVFASRRGAGLTFQGGLGLGIPRSAKLKTTSTQNESKDHYLRYGFVLPGNWRPWCGHSKGLSQSI